MRLWLCSILRCVSINASNSCRISPLRFVGLPSFTLNLMLESTSASIKLFLGHRVSYIFRRRVFQLVSLLIDCPRSGIVSVALIFIWGCNSLLYRIDWVCNRSYGCLSNFPTHIELDLSRKLLNRAPFPPCPITQYFTRIKMGTVI